MKSLLRSALSALLLLPAAPALAQQGQGVIIGTVIDTATRQPLPDVVVTVTSPALQGEQLAVTDARGAYRIPQLPPGFYTLRFEKEGFKPYTREDVQLRPNRTIRVSVELLAQAIEVPPVEDRVPTVDVGNCETRYVNIDPEFLRRLQLARPGDGGVSRPSAPREDRAPRFPNQDASRSTRPEAR